MKDADSNTSSIEINYGKVDPAATKIRSLKAARKGFTMRWYKKSYTGYQIRYSLKSNMNKAKTVTVKSAKTVYRKVKKLSAKRKYYVQIRTYKTLNGKNYYSAWSAKKAITTK